MLETFASENDGSDRVASAPTLAPAQRAGGGACGRRGAANPNPGLASRWLRILAPRRVPGPRARITAAAGKGQCVQVVVSGWVSKSRPRELGGRLGTGRGPCGNGAASPASCLTSKVTPTAPALPIFSPEPQKNHSHHLGNSL